jgi:pilus assembly protein CpaB
MGGRYKIVFWTALLIAGAATFGAYRLLEARSNAGKVVSRSVVLAAADIPEGTLIDRVALTSAVWPVSQIPAGAYESIDSVAGRVARVNVFTGETIVPGRLAPTGSGPGLELKIPPGQRAMSVRINDVAGISGLLQPNSRVDVMVTIASVDEKDQNRQVAKLFMENMRVLSVGTDMQRDKEGQPKPATSVTLAVTPAEAERLAVAMNTGSIHLVLRGFGDPDSVRTSGATSVDVLRQLQGLKPAAPRSASAPARRTSAPRRAAPTPPPVPAVVAKPAPVDSVVVNVYRAGKATPLKFDTVTKK